MFSRNARALGMQVHAADRGSLTALLQDILASNRQSSGVTASLAAALPELRDLAHGSDAWPQTVLSMARGAVASTGSLILIESEWHDRMLGLLCHRHIVVIPAGAMVCTLRDAAGYILPPRIADPGPYVTFVSGPSRTSDIEKVLTIGVHGPSEVIAIMVEGWTPG
jgi:L-lactate utilization protein LutC